MFAFDPERTPSASKLAPQSSHCKWIQAGKIKFREDIVDGLEQAPQAFIGMLNGSNFDKLVVRIANE